MQLRSVIPGDIENEQEYGTDILSPQFSLTNQCGGLMQAIDAHNNAEVEARLKTCPVNARIEAYAAATPLMRAIHACIASSEKEPHVHAATQKILTLLLDHEDVDVNLRDGNNRSVLNYATCFNNPRASKALEILLKYHDENKKPLSVLTKQNETHKVFTWAIEQGHLAGACSLAQRKEVDTNLLDAQGKHALHLLASQTEHAQTTLKHAKDSYSRSQSAVHGLLGTTRPTSAHTTRIIWKRASYLSDAS